jgi:hypothetical protein
MNDYYVTFQKQYFYHEIAHYSNNSHQVMQM